MENKHKLKIISVHTTKPDLLQFTVAELLSLINMHQQIPDLKELFHFEPHFQGRDNIKPYDCRNESFKYFPFIQHAFDPYPGYPKKLISKEDDLLSALDQICQRAVLTQSFVLVLAEASNYESLSQQVLEPELSKLILQNENQKVSLQFFSANRQVSQEEQHKQIDYVTDQMGMKGQIDIKQPTQTYWICEYHQPFSTKIKPTHSETLKRVFFGVQLSFNRPHRRHYTSDFELPTRAYLGPTSTNSQLAFLMANMAQVVKDQVMLDPFCGTGSLLIPTAYFGAFPIGSDIDHRVIHGLGVGKLNPKCSMKLPDQPVKPFMYYNFYQYKLPLPELVRQDCLQNGFKREFFDVIICDPPYGIRAKSSGTGKNTRKKQQKDEENIIQENEEGKQNSEILQQNQEQQKKVYVIPTKKLDPSQLYSQLLDCVYKMLKPNGRFVYLYPFDRDHGDATIDDIPAHNKFEIINFSEEYLTLQKSRILITMIKKLE